MRDLAERMYAGIRPPGAVHGDGLARDRRQCCFQGGLYRRPVVLPLPADETLPVVFARELIARHRSAEPRPGRYRQSAQERRRIHRRFAGPLQALEHHGTVTTGHRQFIIDGDSRRSSTSTSSGEK